MTIDDPDHSHDEQRYLTTGLSERRRLIIVAHTEREGRVRIISARDVTATERTEYEAGESDDMGEDDMRPEYDLRGGVRGKYYKQYMEGTNVVLLDPDVAAVFRDSESVNQALRVLIKAASQIEQAASTKIDRA